LKENNNNDTLHGGPNGWDYRNFTIVAHTTDSITFSIVDPDGEQGFPGEVISYVTYTMTPNTWKIKIVAMATTKKTPIMLTSHVSIQDTLDQMPSLTSIDLLELGRLRQS
jgi:aldose 1-epimerase